MKELVVGTTRIPLGLRRPEQKNRPTRYFDIESNAVLKALKDLEHLIASGAHYNQTSWVASRAKGKAFEKKPTRKILNGYKASQVLVQPERFHYTRSGYTKPVWDCLVFYDLDQLKKHPERYEEAYSKLLPLMEQKQAFVWKNLNGTPKACFWMRNDHQETDYHVFLMEIHALVFRGDEVFRPGLGEADIFKSFVHSQAVLDEMATFFQQEGVKRGVPPKRDQNQLDAFFEGNLLDFLGPAAGTVVGGTEEIEEEKEEERDQREQETLSHYSTLSNTLPSLELYLAQTWGSEATVEPEHTQINRLRDTGWKDWEGELPSWLFECSYMGAQTIKQGTVDAKLLRWMMSSAKALCETGLDIPQLDVSKYLGVSQRAVGKSLQKMQEMGWIEKVPHTLKVLPETNFEMLNNIQGLVWTPVAGEGGEVIAIEIQGHWSLPRAGEISEAMGYKIGPRAISYLACDPVIRFICVGVLKNTKRRKLTVEQVEERLGPPEEVVIPDHCWHDELFNIVKSGIFSSREVWRDYCLRIPGIFEEANTPRIDKLDAIWSWVEKHWDLG